MWHYRDVEFGKITFFLVPLKLIGISQIFKAGSFLVKPETTVDRFDDINDIVNPQYTINSEITPLF